MTSQLKARTRLKCATVKDSYDSLVLGDGSARRTFRNSNVHLLYGAIKDLRPAWECNAQKAFACISGAQR